MIAGTAQSLRQPILCRCSDSRGTLERCFSGDRCRGEERQGQEDQEEEEEGFEQGPDHRGRYVKASDLLSCVSQAALNL